jgi:hypothetical protein
MDPNGNKVKNLVKGLLVIQGKEKGSSAFTVRRQKGEDSWAAEVEWLRDWESMRANPSSAELLPRSRPLRSPAAELHVVHTQCNGNLAPSKYTLRTAYPFALEKMEKLSLVVPYWQQNINGAKRNKKAISRLGDRRLTFLEDSHVFRAHQGSRHTQRPAKGG